MSAATQKLTQELSYTQTYGANKLEDPKLFLKEDIWNFN